MKITINLTEDQFGFLKEMSKVVSDENNKTFMFMPYWFEIDNLDDNKVILHMLGDIPISLQKTIQEFRNGKRKYKARLNIFKMQDDVDGNYAFIVANNIKRAHELLDKETSLPFTYVDSKSAIDFGKTEEGIWINNILPF